MESSNQTSEGDKMGNNEYGDLTLESMIFCMNSDCINYWEDNCFTGELENDDRIPYDLENDYSDSCTKCKRFSVGENEMYNIDKLESK